MSVDVDVRDETRRNQVLADRISAVLSQAVPLIKDVTGLLPGRCTMRLLHPARWRAEVGAHVARQIAREFAEIPATADEQQSAAKVRAQWRRELRRLWPFMKAMTVTDASGRPQTLLSPRALQHAGLDRTATGLEQTVIHEAVHHAQFLAADGTVLPPPFGVRNHAYSDRALGELMEGHADWAELLVSHHLLGRWPEPETRRISLNTAFRQRYLSARNTTSSQVRHWRKAGPPPRRMSREQRRAVFARELPAIEVHQSWMEFVRSTVHQTDLDRWNLVWSDLGLFPSQAEIDAPSDWSRRVGLVGGGTPSAHQDHPCSDSSFSLPRRPRPGGPRG